MVRYKATMNVVHSRPAWVILPAIAQHRFQDIANEPLLGYRQLRHQWLSLFAQLSKDPWSPTKAGSFESSSEYDPELRNRPSLSK